MRKPKVGDRLRCTGPLNDGSLGINNSLIGVEGTVDWLGEWEGLYTTQIGVRWDNGSRLMLLEGDPFEVIEESTEKGSHDRQSRGTQGQVSTPTSQPDDG